MNKFATALAAFMKYLKTYPALAAALANLGVFAAGYLGLHITAGQLTMYVGVANVLLGALVHSNVTPIVKLQQPAAPPALPAATVPPAQ